jgi:hypothetical protein
MQELLFVLPTKDQRLITKAHPYGCGVIEALVVIVHPTQLRIWLLMAGCNASPSSRNARTFLSAGPKRKLGGVSAGMQAMAL